MPHATTRDGVRLPCEEAGQATPILFLHEFKQCRANADQFETLGSAGVAKVTREAPSRIPFLVKGPPGFQGSRPSIFAMTDAIRGAATPAPRAPRSDDGWS